MTERARISTWLDAFRHDRRGVSAVEFALIAPFMVTVYFGLAELADGVTAQRRVAHAAAAAGDLVARADGEITEIDRKNIFAAADNMVEPYPTAPLKLRITSITGNQRGEPVVDWSDGEAGDLPALKRCDEVDLPAGLITSPGENVILAEAVYEYSSPIASVLPNGLSFEEKAYLKPRNLPKVPREGVDEDDACP